MKSYKKIGNDFLLKYFSDDSSTIVSLSVKDPDLVTPFSDIQKGNPDCLLTVMTWGIFDHVKDLKITGKQSIALAIFSERNIFKRSKIQVKYLSHIVIESKDVKTAKKKVTIYPLSEELVSGIANTSIEQTIWTKKTETKEETAFRKLKKFKNRNGEFPAGSKVWFKMENQDMWMGDNQGTLIFQKGQWKIQTKNSGMITIGKGLDAYAGTIELVEN